MMSYRSIFSIFCLLLVGLWVPSLRAQNLDEARRLIEEGETEAAAEAFRQVATSSDDPAERATGYNNACVLLIRLGDYAAALESCREALPLRRQLGDTRRLARGLNNSGLALQHLGRYEEAIEHYEEALELNTERQDWQSVAINLSNIGLLRTTTGRYETASRHFAEAFDLATLHAEEPWAEEQKAVARINYGVLLEKVGAFREALDLYAEILRDTPELSTGRRAQLEVNRGVMLRNLGDPRRAQQAFEEAITYFAAEGDIAGLSNAWLNIGLAQYLNLNQLENAEAAFLRALDKARQSGDAGEELQDLYFLSRLWIDQGKFQDATQALLRCRQLAESSHSEEGFLLADEGDGRLARARGDLPKALQALVSAIQRIEATHQDLDVEVWQAGYLGDKRSIYVAAVETAVALALGESSQEASQQAWTIVQRAKARQLLDNLRGGQSWESDILSARSADDLARALGDGEVLLELFVGETRLYGWAFVDGVTQLHDLGLAAPLLAASRRVHGALSRSESPAVDDLASLSSALLASTGVLEGEIERLFVAADGEFRRLPFELLHSDGDPVIERFALSYLPSASMLLPLRQRSHAETSGGHQLVALGDPRLPPYEEGLVGPADLLRRRFQLPGLPASVEELAAVEEHLGGSAKVLLGDGASEANFRRWSPRADSVLHLATHTLVDEGSLGTSAIVLTPSGDDDGMLFPHEIVDLQLRAPLTVLASCRSGLGDLDGTSALSSLSGAFLTAGSSAVVASLWEVDDQASQVFMQQFYYQLSRHLAPHEALRQAKLRLRRDDRWNRPDIWAAFVLIGDAPPVVGKRWIHRFGWIVGLLLVVIWGGYRSLRRMA